MDNQEALKALERMNLEYLYFRESDDYINSIRLSKLIDKNPINVLKYIKNHINNKEVKKKVDAISFKINREDVFFADPAPLGLTGVAYSCITGTYDKPKEPYYKDPHLTYMMFTDKIEHIDKKNTSIWELKPVYCEGLSGGKNYINRYYKFHPFELFQGYNYSIYLDGNVQIISDVSKLFSIARDSKTGIAMHKHAHMNCIYKNALWCEYNGRGNIDLIHKQVEKYKREGFPDNFGLLEATIIVVDLHNQNAKNLMNQWWTEFIDCGSGRDQISLPYILWKNGFTVDDVGILGNDEYHNPKFRIYEHQGKLF